MFHHLQSIISFREWEYFSVSKDGTGKIIFSFGSAEKVYVVLQVRHEPITLDSAAHVTGGRLLGRVGVGVSLCGSYPRAHLSGCKTEAVKNFLGQNPTGEQKKNKKKNSAMESPVKDSPVRPGFHRMEIQKTTWDVPHRYANLQAIGSGAYGTVW